MTFAGVISLLIVLFALVLATIDVIHVFQDYSPWQAVKRIVAAFIALAAITTFVSLMIIWGVTR